MKTVKVFFLMMAILFVSSFSFAGNVSNSADLNGLNEQQKLEILQQIERVKAEKDTSASSSVTAEEVSEWLKVGQQVASLVPIFAKETCIAAQNVLDSTPGRILLGIVLVKMFWAKIVGLFFLTIGIFTWWRIFYVTYVIKKIVYSPHPMFVFNWLGFRQKTVVRNTAKEIREMADDNNVFFWIFLLTGAVILLCGIIGICN